LIVEDERIIAEDVRRSLDDLGYAVAGSASSGEEAIKLAAETRPDLVLMDIILRGQIDGVRAASQIRSMFDIPVVYLTSHSDEGTLRRAQETGPFGYILKPFEDRELRTTIEMAIYSHRVERMLKESQRWLSVTLRSIADGVIVADADWAVEFMNPAALVLTGWNLKDALGSTLDEVFAVRFARDGEGAARDLIERAFREGVVVHADRDVVLVRRGGGETPVEVNAAPIKDDEGELSGIVLTFHDITERMRAEDERRRLIEELEFLSRTDRMTGIFNRGALIDRLEYELKRSARYGAQISLLLCDIDRFKAINDTYGHSAGDEALKIVARLLRDCVRESDVVGRYGGDEFMVLLPETGVETAREIADRIRERIEQSPVEVSEAGIAVTLSLGLSEFRGGGDTADALIKRADDAMYSSKRRGRNRVSVN
jgi:diguanylate cyclase (GGDEF)-like protein/PAS domain S-box-containing protein